MKWEYSDEEYSWKLINDNPLRDEHHNPVNISFFQFCNEWRIEDIMDDCHLLTIDDWQMIIDKLKELNEVNK